MRDRTTRDERNNALFSDYPGVKTASAGIAPDAETVISADLIDWADIGYVVTAYLFPQNDD
jgi:predicted protein tyrosine phosphatase